MNFTDAVKTGYSKYATFSGRASRSEYWWFNLFFIIVALGLGLLAGAISEIFFMVYAVFALGSLIPILAVTVRRLHDTDRSGVWWFISIVPLIGLIIIYFLAVQGTSGDNQFGPDPIG